jgi:hypothetical protein
MLGQCDFANTCFAMEQQRMWQAFAQLLKTRPVIMLPWINMWDAHYCVIAVSLLCHG